MAAVALPARGRPPEAAARRAGLELVWKVLTAAEAGRANLGGEYSRHSQDGLGRGLPASYADELWGIGALVASQT